MKKQLQRDFQHIFWVGLSTGGNALLSFIAGMLLVRFLPAAEYGLLSVATAVLLVVQEFVGRGINDGLVQLGTIHAAGSAERTCHIFKAGLLLKCLSCILIMALLIGLPSGVGRLLGFNQLKASFPALAMAITGYGIWTYMLCWLQAHMAFGRFAILQPLSNILRTVCYLAFIATVGLGWIPVLWIIAASFWIAVGVTAPPLWRALRSVPLHGPSFNRAFFDLWRCTRWGILSAVAFVALTRMDIFALTHYASATDVALYNAAWQVLIIIDLATVTIMTVMIPKVAHCSTLHGFISWLGRTLLMSGAAAILTLPLVMCPQWYIPMLFGDQYTASIPVIHILYWGNILGLMAFPLVGILYTRHAFHVNAGLQVLLLAVSIPVYAMAAQHKGIIGVAWATLALRGANACLITGLAGYLLKPERTFSPDQNSDGALSAKSTSEFS
jgi:O-antigen/teichoic acid export membrane protein